MPFLTADQKKSLGPVLGILIFVLAVAGGVAVNTLAGGPKVPVISEFSAIILGVCVGLIIFKNLKD